MQSLLSRVYGAREQVHVCARAEPRCAHPHGSQLLRPPGPMLPRIPFDVLEAFVQEHRGGVDNGFVWLQCSYGGLIMHPAGEPPKTAPRAT